MKMNIVTSHNRRILIYGFMLIMFIVIGALFRLAWLNNQYATTLGYQLATEQAARLEVQTLGQQAIMQAKISRSRELAAQSEVADNRDAALKVLLAVESLKSLDGMDRTNPYPSWTQQSLYDALSNIGGLPLTGQLGSVNSLAFSPDGKWLATLSSDGTIFLWNMQDLSTKPTILRLDTSLGAFRLTFSPDGRWLAVGSAKPADKIIVLLWDMKNLSAPPVPLLGNQGWVLSLVFSPDGRRLAAVNPYNAALVWDMQDLTAQPTELRGSTSSHTQDLAFSSDSRWLAVSEYDGCKLWDMQDLSEKPLVLKGSGGKLAFSPDGKWLAATDEYTIRLWDMKKPTSDSLVLKGHSSYVSMLAFSPDGKWLASGGEWDFTYRLWDMNNSNAESIVLGGYESGFHDLYSGPRGLVFSPDGKQLATADNAGGLRLWNIENPSTAPKVLRGHVGLVISLAFSPDGKTLATGGWDKVVRLWDTRHPSIESTSLKGNDEPGGSVKFSPNGRWLARSSADRTIRLWDMQAPSDLPVVLSGLESQALNMIFSQDNHWLVTSGLGIRLWNLQDLTAKPIILGEKGEHYSYEIALSPDTNWLAAKPSYGPIQLWNMKKLSEPPILLRYEQSTHLFWDSVYDLSFSPDGKWLAAACGDEVVRIWSMQSLKSPPITLSEVGFVSKLAFSPDGKWLATTKAEGSTRLWDMQNPSADPLVLPARGSSSTFLSFSPDGKWFAQSYQPSHPNFFLALWDMQRLSSNPTLTLTMDHSEIRAFNFSPSGKWLAANSWDEAIYLWDMQNLKGAPLLLHGYGSDTLAIAFSPDEQWLVTVGKENSVRLWQMNLNALGNLACQYAGRNLTHTEWSQYFFKEPYRATCPAWPVEPEPSPNP